MDQTAQGPLEQISAPYIVLVLCSTRGARSSEVTSVRTVSGQHRMQQHEHLPGENTNAITLDASTLLFDMWETVLSRAAFANKYGIKVLGLQPCKVIYHETFVRGSCIIDLNT